MKFNLNIEFECTENEAKIISADSSTFPTFLKSMINKKIAEGKVISPDDLDKMAEEEQQSKKTRKTVKGFAGK